jgi:Protein of unknown function (DUF3768)
VKPASSPAKTATVLATSSTACLVARPLASVPERRFGTGRPYQPSPLPRPMTIAELNDAFRRSLVGGRVVLTPGIRALPQHTQAAIIGRVRSFEEFDADNDPFGQHNCSRFEHGGQTILWQIDLDDRVRT